MCGRLPGVAILSLLLVAPAVAEPESCVAARGKLVADLAQLAAWCQQSQAFLDRDATYELILRFDPDHAEARKWLKYTRRKGEWVRPSKYLPPKNHNAEAHAEYGTRRAAIVRAFADFVVAEVAREDAPPPPADRRRLLADAVAADPDHEAARKAAGYARMGERWVLVETQRAAERRAALKRVVKSEFALIPNPPPEGVTLVEGLASPFVRAATGKHWKAVTTKNFDDLSRAVSVATAAAPVLDACLGVKTKPQPGHTLCLFSTQAELDDALRATGIDGRAHAIRAGGASSAAHRRVLVYGTETPARLGRAARHATALVLERELGIAGDTGWAREGTSLYVASLLVDWPPRYAFADENDLIRDAPGAEFLRDLYRRDSDWFSIARGLVTTGGAPTLAELLRKDAARMKPADFVLAFALAAYLIEGHADRVPDLFAAGAAERLTTRDGIARAVRLEPDELEERLRAWLLEQE